MDLARRALALLVGGLLLGPIVSVVVSGQAVAAHRPAQSPLSVTIESLTPSSLTTSSLSVGRGRVTVTGTVSNQSLEMWSDINVHLATSTYPLTTPDELTAAAATGIETDIGARLTGDGQFDPVGDLAPGQGTPYRISVPRSDISPSSEPGVYWLGVQALGSNSLGRDTVADGRARVFLPSMSRSGPRTRLSVLVPVKGSVQRGPDWSLLDPARWQRLLGAQGRLGRLVRLGVAAKDVPFTWIVDPAVVDATASLAAGNPPLNTEPTSGGPSPRSGATTSPGTGEPSTPGGAAGTDSSSTASAPAGGSSKPGASPDASADASTSASPDKSPGASPGASPDASPGASPDAPATGRAGRWLASFSRAARHQPVLSVPYGDLDVAAAVRSQLRWVVRRANQLSLATMNGHGLPASSVLAPRTGFLPEAALTEGDPATPLVLSQAALPGSVSTVPTRPSGPAVVLQASSVAPGDAPSPSNGPIALRQRILGEAAVHALSSQASQPLVTSTPQLWNPGPDWRTTQLFAGLDVPWLRLVDLPQVLVSTAPRNAIDEPSATSGLETEPELMYPRSEAAAEVPAMNITATTTLSRSGRVFDELLPRNDTVSADLDKAALLASSVQARRHPAAAVTLAERTSAHVRSQLGEVTLESPPFVTMSSDQGSFQVTLINDLSQPVSVGITARVLPNPGNSRLTISPPGPVTLGPGQRSAVRLRATATDIGVYSVRLMPTTDQGRQLSAASKLSVRSSQVGLVVWVIMGLAGAVFAVAVGLRILRQVRLRKATPGPLLDATGRRPGR